MVDPSRHQTDPLDVDPYIILERHEIFERLSVQQVRSLILLAGGMKKSEVAASVQCGASTIAKWLKEDDDFRQALNLTVGYLYQYGLKKCAVAAATASQVLLSIASDTNQRAGDRVRAAIAILDNGGKWHQSSLEDRIGYLEQVIGDYGDNQESAREAIS